MAVVVQCVIEANWNRPLLALAIICATVVAIVALTVLPKLNH